MHQPLDARLPHSVTYSNRHASRQLQGTAMLLQRRCGAALQLRRAERLAGGKPLKQRSAGKEFCSHA